MTVGVTVKGTNNGSVVLRKCVDRKFYGDKDDVAKKAEGMCSDMMLIR